MRGTGLKVPLVGVAIILAGVGQSVEAKVPPLRDPVFLNIGFVCQWQESCIQKQKRAHKRALSYVKRWKPPAWKVQLCNHRSTQRRSGRVDWIAYNNCIRNPKVRRPSSVARRR